MINTYYSEYLFELYSNCQRLHSYQFGQTDVEKGWVKYSQLHPLVISLILMRESSTLFGFTLLYLNRLTLNCQGTGTITVRSVIPLSLPPFSVYKRKMGKWIAMVKNLGKGMTLHKLEKKNTLDMGFRNKLIWPGSETWTAILWLQILEGLCLSPICRSHL